MQMNRFWIGGPCEENGEEIWLVIDGDDLAGMRRAIKPAGYTEQWPTEAQAQAHADQMNSKDQGR